MTFTAAAINPKPTPSPPRQHSEEILKELGCTDAEIHALKDAGTLLPSVWE